jgi:hypothetical protein
MYRNAGLSLTALRAKWFTTMDKKPKVIEKRIIRLFGAPPYRFLQFGDPVPHRFRTRKRRPILDVEYIQKHPVPNYNALPKNPNFVQTPEELHWFWASGRLLDSLVKSGEIEKPKKSTRIERFADLGTRAMFVRLPISAKRERTLFPKPDTRIELVHQTTGLVFHATVLRIFVVDKRSTGWAILTEFSNFGDKI